MESIAYLFREFKHMNSSTEPKTTNAEANFYETRLARGLALVSAENAGKCILTFRVF